MSKRKKNKVQILNTLRILKEDLNKRYRVKSIGLFGSYVNDKQKDTKTSSAVIRKFEIIGEALWDRLRS